MQCKICFNTNPSDTVEAILRWIQKWGFGLEHLTNPDPDVMAKLERDNNAAAFREDRTDRVFQIELDALNALMPDDKIALLEDSVDRHFESIYRQVMEDKKHYVKAIWIPSFIDKITSFMNCVVVFITTRHVSATLVDLESRYKDFIKDKVVLKTKGLDL